MNHYLISLSIVVNFKKKEEQTFMIFKFIIFFKIITLST